MRRIFVLTAFVALGLGAGCSLDPEKQWYKPGSNYTVADWDRDRVACTKNGALDEDCLRAKGWTALSGDVAKPPPAVRDNKGNMKY